MNPSHKPAAETGKKPKSAPAETLRLPDHETPHDVDAFLGDLSEAESAKALAALGFIHDVREAFRTEKGAGESETSGSGNMPSFIGRYRILGSLGRGGFAEVFLAEDEGLNRRVALKVPLFSGVNRPDLRARFEREARSAAMLAHPNIVPVLEFDYVGQVAFIACGWIPGTNLAEWLHNPDQELTVKVAAEIIVSLADAIEHAHQRGVVHRDLKPSNILVREPENGHRKNLAERVVITDFGLARHLLHDQQQLTHEGSTVGTPAYMSPEQAAGQASITTATDIWSLGVILFELLTGRVPFRGESLLAILQSVQQDSPPSMRQLNPAIPRDLAAICRKCLRKNPAERYPSAFELANDLRRWMNGFPVSARTPSAWSRTVFWVQRNPAAAGGIAAAVLFFTAGLAGTTWQWNVARSNATRYKAEYDRAEVNLAAAGQALDNERTQRIRAQRIARWLGNTYRSPDPAIQGRELKVVQLLERAEKEIGQEFPDDAETRWTLWLAIARAWYGLGENQSALALLELIRDEQSNSMRPDDEMTVELMTCLARASANQGEIATALSYSERGLDLAARILDPRHLLTCRLKLEKASALANLGRIDDAMELRLEVVKHYRTMPEIDDEERLNAEWAVANGLVQKRELTAAESAFDVLIPELEATLGTDYPLTLTAKNDYANALFHQNKHVELAILRRDLFESTERVMGPNHPNTFLVLNNLAVSLSLAGQKHQALDCWADQLNRAKTCFGDQSAYYFLALISPANTFRELGNSDEALARYEIAVPGLQNTLGHTHAKVLPYQVSWAELLEQEGQFEKAFSNWDQIRAAHLEAGGGPGLQSESAAFRQALLKIRMGEVESGIESAARFFNFLPKLDWTPDELNSLSCRSHGSILKALVEVGAFAGAVPFSDRYLVLADSVSSRDCDPVVALWFQAVILAGTGDFERTRLVLEQCLSGPLPILPEPEFQWNLFCIDTVLKLSESATHPLNDFSGELRVRESGLREINR